MSAKRVLLSALLIVGALTATTSTAFATVVEPYGKFTGTAAPATLTFSPSLKIACSSATIGGISKHAEVGKPATITGEAPTFGGCTTSGGLGPATITPKGAVNYEFAFWTREELKTVVSKISLHVMVPSLGCSFDLNGWAEARNFGITPLTVSVLPLGATSSLTESNVSAGACSLLFHAGLTAELAGNYQMSPALVVKPA